MGNNQIKEAKKHNHNLSQVIDYIATNYILTQNFVDMKNLEKKEYCDKLVVLTSRIISSELNEREVEFLSQRTENGMNINKLKSDNLIYFPKQRINEINVKVPLQKKRMCIGIAKYYVKIAHLFAAISKTINKQYNYKDENKFMQQTSLKQNLPDNKKGNINKLNICSKRLKALVGNEFKLNDVLNGNNFSIKSKICSFNNNTKILSDEPGIPELKSLYYDKYNYDTGKFTSMSKESEKQYMEDINTFYKIFTQDTKDKPNEIKNFSDIKLKDYSKSKLCSLNNEITGNVKNNLFENFAKHIQKMMKSSEENYNELINILNSIFVIQFNKNTNHKEITINPKLNMEKLNEIIKNTRNIIIKLYVNCEEDFVKGIEIYTAIAEKQNFDNSKRQIHNLNKNINKLIPQNNINPINHNNQELKQPIVLQPPPVEHRPVEHRPVEHRPVEHRPVEHLPVEHRPVEHLPVEHRPVEHRPVEHRPVEHRPVVQTHV